MVKSRFWLKKLEDSRFAAPLIGVLVSLLIFGVVAAAASLILLNQKNPSEQIGISSLLVLIISAAASGFLTSRLWGKGGFANSLISQAAVAVLIIIFGAFSGGISVACLMNAATYLGVGAGSAFLGRPKAKRKFRNSKFISG